MYYLYKTFINEVKSEDLFEICVSVMLFLNVCTIDFVSTLTQLNVAVNVGRNVIYIANPSVKSKMLQLASIAIRTS